MLQVVNQPAQAIALPAPRVAIGIRPGTIDDLPFMDSLQRIHTRQVGWMPTAQFEGKIKLGHVLIAEEPSPQPFPGVPGEGAKPVGYCIGNDQYFKRDDVGIIYQMNVVPDRQRGLIGATLVKAMFDRAAYGCKLFCCWCAQDIEANHFWESLGFIPLAFRAGSRGKGRVHIFWQRRIRAGDTTTPYWFPSQTTSGSIREDRIVLPIPPGTHWRDAKPLVLPGAGDDEPKQLPAPKPKKRAGIVKPANVPSGGLWFAVPAAPAAKENTGETPVPRKKAKNDPRLVAAARELKDRWLEQVNADPSLFESSGKYELSKELVAPTAPIVPAPALLPSPLAA